MADLTMNWTNGRVFCLSVLTGIVFVVSCSWMTSPSRRQKLIHNVDNSGIYLTDQIRSPDFTQFRKLRIATIVDMRPDGESADQTPSQSIAAISKRHGIAFAYIPIPH